MYNFARIVFWLYLHLFNRYKVVGKENIVWDGPTIVYGNHSSDFDIFLLTVTFRRHIYFMAKKSLFETPVIKWFVKAYKAFPVDRDKNDLAAIKTALRLLKDGKQVGIFPEGTRVLDEQDSNAKGGVAMFAYKTGATLVPVRMKYKRRLNLFNRYDVIIGKPIRPEELGIVQGTSDEYKAVGTKLMEHVYEL